jgi:transcriptional regulator with GAF, ATPase, and Fis domain
LASIFIRRRVRYNGPELQQPKDTLDHPWARGHGGEAGGLPQPGLLLVFSAGHPRLAPIPLDGRPIVVGRGQVGPIDIDDAALSRQHAEVALEGDSWRVRDLGSRNGTAVDARPLAQPLVSAEARVLRCGASLFLLAADLRPFARARIEIDGGIVVGPRLRRVWNEIGSIAARGHTLHITGETGSGKELAARRFHAAGPRPDGAFIAVNCATIPAALAERLLFGARKGAYSGADADTEGYVQAAHGGSLFLDEVAELEPAVQAKLLRVLETREVVPLGGAQGRKVDVRLISATHGGLRARVTDGRFREDLYFRIGRPEVRLPPLRERAEEIPWLVQVALDGGTAHVSLVERALAAAWPGNVRELVLEIREAARRASGEGTSEVQARHLDPDLPLLPSEPQAPEAQRPKAAVPAREELVAALEANAGNVAATARALGVHRTQLRRWLEKLGLSTPKDE